MPGAELAVVGAGPAGLSAAVTAARLGLQVTLIDEYFRPGGQYLKGEASPTHPPLTPTERQGRALLDSLSSVGVTYRGQTTVWGIEGARLALYGPNGSERLEANAVIAATGARELVLPVPGWTLPGVMTVGGMQVLAKAHGVLPGRRILLAGTGPLLLAAAHSLIEHGAQVVAVLEATRPAQWIRFGAAVWGQWSRMREGGRYLATLRQSKTPYRFGRTVVQIQGANKVEAAVVARLDSRGHPISGSEETVPVDAVGLGFGFIPNIELTQLAGCTHQYDPRQGGWVPLVKEHQATDVPGIFAAGESAGIAGANAAMLSGEIAAWGAACYLERISHRELSNRLNALRRKRRNLQRFAAMLNTLFTPPLLEPHLPDGTIICRCEDVTVGQVRRAIANGTVELDALKTCTRAGQGLCQGRTCGPLLSRLVAQQTGRSPAEAGSFRPRPPLKPVPLDALAREALR